MFTLCAVSVRLRSSEWNGLWSCTLLAIVDLVDIEPNCYPRSSLILGYYGRGELSLGMGTNRGKTNEDEAEVKKFTVEG
jgi:hypothetical protein